MSLSIIDIISQEGLGRYSMSKNKSFDQIFRSDPVTNNSKIKNKLQWNVETKKDEKIQYRKICYFFV